MRKLVGGKNTIGRMAAVLKSPMKRPLPLPYSIKSVKNSDLLSKNTNNNIINNCNSVELTTPMTAFGPIILKFATN